MNEKELKELLRDLQEWGLEPMLCDTPVTRFDAMVPCGKTQECLDESWDTVLLPKALLSMHPEFIIPVKGDSMKDAGIVTGDMVKIMGDITPIDGDIVLASIDGGYTLKTYFEDDEGRQWLVPQNEDYDPILLEEGKSVRIYGKVKEVIKFAPRVASRICMKAIRRMLAQKENTVEITPMKLSQAIRVIAPMVKKGRQWYAVYRVLVDYELVKEEDFDGFIELVMMEVPGHQHPPKRLEMQRMAVQSFAKPVRMWQPDYAPVQGTRYAEYSKIAWTMKELLDID